MAVAVGVNVAVAVGVGVCVAVGVGVCVAVGVAVGVNVGVGVTPPQPPSVRRCTSARNWKVCPTMPPTLQIDPDP